MAVALPIASLDNPRLAHYRNLRDRVLRRDGGRFIAESQKVVERLLASGWPVDSVLCAERRVGELQPIVPDDVALYVVSDALMTATAGFAIHTGVLAIGRRPPQPSLDELIARHEARGAAPANDPLTLVVCAQLKETANMGAIVRIAAGLGAAGLVIGPTCCDPLYRRAIRVSMGAVFSLPIVRSDDLPAAVRRLRDRHAVASYATVLSDDAIALPAARPPRRAAVVLGHEVHGLPTDLIAACDHRLTLPMAGATDSLNVAMSAAVFLYALRQQQRDAMS